MPGSREQCTAPTSGPRRRSSKRSRPPPGATCTPGTNTADYRGWQPHVHSCAAPRACGEHGPAGHTGGVEEHIPVQLHLGQDLGGHLGPNLPAHPGQVEEQGGEAVEEEGAGCGAGPGVEPGEHHGGLVAVGGQQVEGRRPALLGTVTASHTTHLLLHPQEGPDVGQDGGVLPVGDVEVEGDPGQPGTGVLGPVGPPGVGQAVGPVAEGQGPVVQELVVHLGEGRHGGPHLLHPRLQGDPRQAHLRRHHPLLLSQAEHVGLYDVEGGGGEVPPEGPLLHPLPGLAPPPLLRHLLLRLPAQHLLQRPAQAHLTDGTY